MSKIQPTDVVWALLKLLGIDKDKRVVYRLVLFVILSIYLLTQSVVCIIIRWNDASSRYLAMEDFEYTLAGLWFMLDMLLKPSDIWTMVQVIESKFFVYNNLKLSEEKMTLIDNNLNGSYKMVWIIFFLDLAHVSSNCLIPLFISIYQMLSFRLSSIDSINIVESNGTTHYDLDLPLPFENWLPFTLNNPIVYLSVYSVHFIYGEFGFFCCATIMLASPIAVFQRITTDMQLMNISIKQINDTFKDKFLSSQRYVNDKSSLNDDQVEDDELKLHKCQKELIENHQTIIRRVKTANGAIATIALNINQAAAVFGCLSLYRTIEMETISDGIKNAILSVFNVTITFAYCHYGQRLQDEDAKLRNALAEFDWLSKPIWFQKSHLIMMTQSNKTLEIKPFGIYSLNYDNFKNVMRAAYTFCNALLSIRKT